MPLRSNSRLYIFDTSKYGAYSTDLNLEIYIDQKSKFIQLTNAAPPFDIDSFLDELLAMNVRMGDFILKAKSEYKELKANELTDTTVAVNDNSNQGDDQLNGYETSFSGNESHDSVIETGNDVESTADDKIKKAERSFIGPALDGIRNHWNGWFDKKKIVDDDSQDGTVIDAKKDDEVNKTVEDVVLPVESDNNSDIIAQAQSSDQPPIDQLDVTGDGFSDQKCLGTSDKPTDNTEPDNSEPNKSEPDNSEPKIPGPDDTEVDKKTETSQQGAISDSDDVGHDQDLGEETFNNKSEDEKGWLDNAIDGIVSFFG